MKTLTGKLEFISLFSPILLDKLDLRDDIFAMFNHLNGRPTSMKNTMNSIEIFADDNSEYNMKFKKDDVEESILMILNKDKGFGMSNLAAYLPDMLQRLNGMQVIVTIEDNCIKFENDPNEQVFELKYTDNNSCSVSDDKVKEICKAGEKDCCIFLTMSANGFQCDKFNSAIAGILLDRYSRGTMRASRIGNCKIVGRIS